MSLSGQINGVFSGKPDTVNRKPLITWSGTQSIAGNYTDVTVNFIFWQASSTYYSYNLNTSGSSSHLNTVNINGDTVGGQITTPYDTRNTSGNLTLRSHTVRVYHNQDGTKTCWIGWSGDTNTTRGTYSFGTTVTLDTIPRAASITSSADLTIGNNLAYTLKNDGGLYVKLQLHIWNGSNYSLVFDSNRGTGASGTVTLGTTENNIMYAAMPSNTSRSCVFRAYTYSDSGYSVQVGSYQDVVGTVYINQTTNKPTFTTYTVGNLDKTIVNTDKYSNVLVTSSTSTLLGADTKMIKGYSKLRAVITSANKMVALNSATSIKYRFTVGSAYNEQNYSASSTVNLDVDNATTNSVSVTAYDSRSLTTTVANSTSITNNANYVPVSLWGLTLTRDNGVDDGVKLAISGSYWKEYFGGGTSGVQNTITAHYRYKETTAAWGAQTWTALTLTDSSGALSFDDYIEGDLGASGFDTEKSFNIEVRIYDKLTNYILEGTLNVGTPVIDITSSGISLMGKYDATIGGELQVARTNVMTSVCHLYQRLEGSGQSINGNELILFGAGSELYDPLNWHSTSTNTTRITCEQEGLYLAYGSIQLGDDTNNSIRILSLRKNGSNFVETRTGGDAGGRWAGSCISPVYLQVNDYIEMSMYFSGAAPTLVRTNAMGLMRIV